MTTRRLLLAGTALLTAVASACGGGDGGAAAVKPATLQEALGMDAKSMQERERKVQDAVARCMRDEGFEYVPIDPSQLRMEIRGPGSFDTSRFRRTRGYGISTGLLDRPTEQDRNDNPNDKIKERLSEPERRAWERALWGEFADPDVPGGGVIIRGGPGAGGDGGDDGAGGGGGCFQKAQASVAGGPNPETLGPKLMELDERVRSDPRMVKANADWARCMADAGYSYESPEEIVEYLGRKLAELQGVDPPDDGGPGIQISGPAAMADLDSEKLNALQHEELAIAKADDRCSIETKRRATATKVREEAEQRFLEENPDLTGGAS
jgi:hypothetical protein